MGSVATAVLTALLVIVVVISVKSYSKKLTSGCCGGGDVPKPQKVDKNPDHYSHHVMLQIEGMTCQNCAKRVENALNAIDGVWAEVDLKQKRAKVRQKEQIPVEKLCAAVEKAGYHAKI